jgi:hypothetical protein
MSLSALFFPFPFLPALLLLYEKQQPQVGTSRLSYETQVSVKKAKKKSIHYFVTYLTYIQDQLSPKYGKNDMKLHITSREDEK